MKLTVNTLLALVEQQVGSTAQGRFGATAWLRRLYQLQLVASKTPDIGTVEIQLPVQRRRRRITKKKSPSAPELTGTDVTSEARVASEGE